MSCHKVRVIKEPFGLARPGQRPFVIFFKEIAPRDAGEGAQFCGRGVIKNIAVCRKREILNRQFPCSQRSNNVCKIRKRPLVVVQPKLCLTPKRERV